LPPSSNRGRPAPAVAAETKDAEKTDHPGTGAEIPLLALPEPAEAGSSPAPASPASPPAGVGGGAAAAPAAAPTSPVALPSLPAPPVTQVPVGPVPVMPPGAEAPRLGAVDPNAPAAPVLAPQRRGPISSMFNGMTSWLRR
jgi:ribonuclease E